MSKCLFLSLCIFIRIFTTANKSWDQPILRVRQGGNARHARPKLGAKTSPNRLHIIRSITFSIADWVSSWKHLNIWLPQPLELSTWRFTIETRIINCYTLLSFSSISNPSFATYNHQPPTNMSSQILSPTTETLHHSYPQHHTPLQPTYNLDDLVSDIKAHLGDSNGIGSEDIDAEHLISLARKYISDPADWVQYFHNDPSKNYTRNAIENINKKANIVCCCHSPFSSDWY